MKNIRLKCANDIDMSIKYFIDNELNAPHMNSIVFLYCLKNFDIIKNITQICVKTNTTNEQVVNALEYWEAKGFCDIEYLKNDDTHQIELFFNQNKTINIVDNSTEDNDLEENDKQINNVKILEKSSYKPDEIKYFKENDKEINEMFEKAQKILSKPLSNGEMNTLLDMYERLKLPFDMINEIIEYSVSNNRRNLRYISGMAQNMTDLGIDNIGKFRVYTNKNKDIYKEVLNAIGGTNPMASPAQIKLIDTWTNEYEYSLDVILEACDIACINTSNPTLSYVEGILKNWRKANIKTVLDVQEYEKKYLNEKEENNKKRQANKIDLSKVKSNPKGFNNFKSREHDFDYIAKKLDVSYKN